MQLPERLGAHGASHLKPIGVWNFLIYSTSLRASVGLVSDHVTTYRLGLASFDFESFFPKLYTVVVVGFGLWTRIDKEVQGPRSSCHQLFSVILPLVNNGTKLYVKNGVRSLDCSCSNKFL